MVSIKDVALKAGVSVSTVSHVVNETRYVAPDTMGRVNEAIDALGYRPSSLARALKMNRTLTIGMLVTNSTNPFFAEVVRGVEDGCYQHDYSLILCNSGDERDRQLAYLETLMMKRIDALVVMTTNNDPAFYDELRSIKDVPMVILDSDSDLDACVIGDDSVLGGRLATEFLIKRGFKSIGCLTGPADHPRSRDRRKGFVTAMAAADVRVNDAWIIEGDLTATGGYKAMRRLLAADARPDALFAFNDLMAMGAFRAAMEEGLSIPDDLSIIGYDDLEIAQYLMPSLTTIRQPSFVLGARAADILIDYLENKTDMPAVLSLKPELVVRDSVGKR